MVPWRRKDQWHKEMGVAVPRPIAIPARQNKTNDSRRNSTLHGGMESYQTRQRHGSWGAGCRRIYNGEQAEDDMKGLHLLSVICRLALPSHSPRSVLCSGPQPRSRDALLEVRAASRSDGMSEARLDQPAGGGGAGGRRAALSGRNPMRPPRNVRGEG